MYVTLARENKSLNYQAIKCNSVSGIKCRNKATSLVVKRKLHAVFVCDTNTEYVNAEFLVVAGAEECASAS